MQDNNSLHKFFKVQAIGFVICSIRVSVNVDNLEQFLWNLFLLFMLCNIISIWTGLANMFGGDLYLYIKKNLKNEQRFGSKYCDGVNFDIG